MIKIFSCFFNSRFNIFENKYSLEEFIKYDGLCYLCLLLEYFYQILCKIEQEKNDNNNFNQKDNNKIEQENNNQIEQEKININRSEQENNNKNKIEQFDNNKIEKEINNNKDNNKNNS